MSDGAEGPRTPPAPESPEPEPPLESETPPPPAEPAEEASTEARRPRLLPVWILLGAALVSGAAWAVTEYMGGGPPPDEAQVPLIAASAEPWKVRPDEPGGLEIPNRDALIYETLNTADPEEGPERILPPPEEPLSPPRPAADVADELAVAAIEPENAAAPPVAAPAQEPVPEPPVEAALEPFLEPEATEPAPVVEAPPAEPETPSFVPAVPPRPPKPGTLAALQIDESPLTELDATLPVEEAPRPGRRHRPCSKRRRRRSPMCLPHSRIRRWRAGCRSRSTSRSASRGPHGSGNRQGRASRRYPNRRNRPPDPGVTYSSALPMPGARWRAIGKCCAAVTTTCSSASAR